jgi:hypothetical protein
MNTNLLAIVKQIVAEQGEDILSQPRRVFDILSESAKEIPKPQKSAFINCLKHESAQVLKTTAKPERDACKQQLVQKLHDEEGIDPRLCTEAYELLAAVLFGEEQEKVYCKNCGKELQEGWIKCPFCATLVNASQVNTSQVNTSQVNTSQVISPAVSSGSGGREYGIEQLRPAMPTFTNNTVDITAVCNGCSFNIEKNNIKECDYFSCNISEAVGYYCGMKTSDSNYQTARQMKKPTFFTGAIGLISIFGVILMFIAFPVGMTFVGIALFCRFVQYIIKGNRRKNARRI